jgi:hypothetical protein
MAETSVVADGRSYHDRPKGANGSERLRARPGRARIRPGIDHIDRITMVNYILLYKIKKKVKAMIKDKLALGELATTPSSCLDCLATDLSWEMYYIMKEKEEA